MALQFDTGAARSTLADFCAALDGAGFAGRYWLSCGTLLGYRREGNFIAHDGDIDIGILASDYRDDLVTTLQDSGFTLRRRRGTQADGLTLTFAHRGTKVDIFFHYRAGDRLWHLVTKGPPEIRYSYPAFGLTPSTFLDIPVFVPDRVDEVLEAAYGAQWRQPVSRWHYAYSPYNVEVVGGLPSKGFFWLKNGIWQVKSRLRAAVKAFRHSRSADRA